jgi:hypothetical protein
MILHFISRCLLPLRLRSYADILFKRLGGENQQRIVRELIIIFCLLFISPFCAITVLNALKY